MIATAWSEFAHKLVFYTIMSHFQNSHSFLIHFMSFQSSFTEKLIIYVSIFVLTQQPTSSVQIFWYKYSVQFSKGALSWLSIKKRELQTNLISSAGQRFASFLLQCEGKIKTTLTVLKGFKTVNRTINTHTKLLRSLTRTFQGEES